MRSNLIYNFKFNACVIYISRFKMFLFIVFLNFNLRDRTRGLKRAI